MKAPKRIQEIIDKKKILIASLRSGFDSQIIGLQGLLLDEILQSLIPKLEIRNGIILETANNYRVLQDIETTFRRFQAVTYEKLLPSVVKSTDRISNLSKAYFTVTFAPTIPERFDSILKAAKKLTDARLGLAGGKIVRGGLLWSITKLDSTALKYFVSQAVTSGMSMKDFIKEIRSRIMGVGENAGLFERQVKRYAYDIYQQYDASYNMTLAKEFGMKYFIYQGGLVADSRDFCIAHNEKVLSTDEAEKWKDWTPDVSIKNGDFPPGYVVQQKDTHAHPGYMDYPGYDPLIDRGGYNCRHFISYISDGLAFKLRPELTKNKVV